MASTTVIERDVQIRQIMRYLFTGFFILFIIFVFAGYKSGLAFSGIVGLIILGTLLDESAKETQIMRKFLGATKHMSDEMKEKHVKAEESK